MPILRKYSTLLLTLLAVLTYFALYTSLGHDGSKFIVDSLTLGIAVIIAGSWSSAAYVAIRNGGASGEDKIILTIWGAWTTLVVQRIYVIFSTITNQPDWLTQGFMPGLVTTLIGCAGTYAIIAPIQDGKAPHQEILWTIGITVLGSLIAGIVIGLFISKQAFGAHL